MNPMHREDFRGMTRRARGSLRIKVAASCGAEHWMNPIRREESPRCMGFIQLEALQPWDSSAVPRGQRHSQASPSLLAYCLSNTNTSLIDRACPSVPTLVTVATLPSLEMVRVPVM